MKYLKAFNESNNINDLIDLLVDIFNDLCDDYNIIIEKDYQYNFIKIIKGSDIIKCEEFEKEIYRAISHCYRETGQNVFLSTNKYRYEKFIYDYGECDIYLDVTTDIKAIGHSKTQKWFFNLSKY